MPRSSISPVLGLGAVGGTVGAMLALAASVEGCSAILGDFSFGPESDASTASGSPPDAAVPDGSDGGSPRNGTGDGAPANGTGDGAPANGTGSDAGLGDGGAVCSAGSTQCADGGVQDCVDGTW